MTEREALKLAMGALEKYAHDFGSSDLSVKAMYVARNALAQPEQEPVAWITQGGKGWLRWHKSYDDNKDSIPLYTTPPQRTWVGLTSEEIGEIYRVGWANNMELARAIEQKLKEKNVGTI